MRKGKKFITLLLSVLTVFSTVTTFPFTANAVETDIESVGESYISGDFGYELLDDGTAEIISYFGDDSDVKVPGVIDGHTVTSIGDNSFSWCENRESITFPDSVNSISPSGIWCENLIVNGTNPNYSSVDGVLFNKDKTKLVKYPSGKSCSSYTIPNGVISIGNYAFYDSTSLDGVIIPNTVVTIGKYAFQSCPSLKSIIIPGNVSDIGDNAFALCDNLTDITISDGVKTIGSYAFFYCTSLCNIKISGSVTSLGSFITDGCTSLMNINVDNSNQTYCSIDGVLYNKNKTEIITYPQRKEGTSYIIPDSVTKVADDAFCNCKKLSSITIPNSVKTLGNRAFAGCEGLKSVDIPDSVNSLGTSAFSGCSGLSNINISNGVRSLADYAFSYCSGISEIIIPNSVTDIGKAIFNGCSNLKNIKADSDNLKYTDIDGVLFSKDKTEIVAYPIGKADTAYSIPSGVKEILNSAFSGCPNLKKVTIPNGTVSIGNSAFLFCENLANITIPDSVNSIGSDALSETAWYESMPEGLVYAGKVVYNYKGDMPENTSITLAEGTTGIAGSAFAFCDSDSLTKIYMPDSVITIGDHAFMNCGNLADVTISNNVKKINSGTFYGCTSIEEISIPDGVESIGHSAFTDCTSLKKVSIPNSVTSIGHSAFSNCTALQTVTIPDSLTSISEYTFSGCTSLSKVDIPNSVTDIVYSAFQNCDSLAGVSVPKSVKSIGKHAIGYSGKYKTVEAEYVYSKKDGFSISGYSKTAAETYANDNEFTFISLGTATVSGDANGDGEINAKDRMMLTRHLAKWSGYENIDMTAADLNNDGAVNAKDRMILTRHIAKWSGYETLPYTK